VKAPQHRGTPRYLPEVVPNLGINFLEEIKIIGVLHVFSFFNNRQGSLELLHVETIKATEQLRLVFGDCRLDLFRT
jgi:hypothetical protein